MSFREFYSLSEAERNAHIAMWGGYNDYPPGWRKITEREFAGSSFFTYAPDLVEYRQMVARTPALKKFMPDWAVSTHLYFLWNGTGYAMVADQRAGKVTFYAFGCDHKYVPDADYRAQFNCDNGYKCTKCGHKYAVDSSD